MRLHLKGSRDWNRRTKSLGACLAVGLATAWTSPAEAAVVHLEVSPAADLSQGYVLYNNYVPNSSFSIALFALGNLSGGQTAVFNHDIPSWTDENVQGPGAGYMVFALHGEPGSQGISLGFADDSLVTSGGSWDSFIASTYGPNGYTPEQFIVDHWGENFVRTLSISFPQELRRPFGVTATLVNMSDAVYGGTAIATVPEPGCCTLLVTGAGLLLAYARRRRG
jgi:hypothetical protein